MEDKKCWRHGIYGAVSVLIVFFLICMFLFPSIGIAEMENYIHRHGSLIAGLIALFAAIYTVNQHKKQSKKEIAERDRREALASLMEIDSQTKFLSGEMMNYPASVHHLEMLEEVVAQLVNHSIIIDNYLIHSHDEVAKLQSALIFEQSILLKRYLMHSRVLKQNAEMLDQDSIEWRAEELNDDYLGKIRSVVDRINTLSNDDRNINLYDANFVFKRDMRNDCDIGRALSSLNVSVIEKLIAKVRLMNEIR